MSVIGEAQRGKSLGRSAPLLGVLTLTAAFVRLGNAPTPTSNLYLALIVENLVVLVFALVVAGAAVRFAPIQKGLR